MMRRLLGIGFLAVFAYTLIGVYPVQWALRRSAKEEMKVRLRACGGSNEDVLMLSFPWRHGKVSDARFEWEEEGEEFSYDGGMYDVIDSDVKDGTISFRCLSDEKETKLVAHAKAVDEVGGSDRSRQQSSKALFKFISERYVRGATWSLNRFSSPNVLQGAMPRAQVSPGYEPHFAPPPRG